MEHKSSKTSFLDLLGVAFIVLKLCKVITWSWFWVLSPMWVWLIGIIIWSAIEVYQKHKGE